MAAPKRRYTPALVSLVGDLERRVLSLESHATSEKERVNKLEMFIAKLDESLDKLNNKLSYWSGAVALGAFVFGYFVK